MVAFARGTWRWALPPVVAGLAAAVVWVPAGIVLFALSGAVVWFHRDPDRVVGEGLVAPADGTVSVLRETDDGRLRLGIFMNLHHVHVNRAPMAGTVRAVEHSPGGHMPAFTKSAERNERLTVECEEYTLVLIAGAVARRIHPYVTAGTTVERGQRIGHISFSSRVDVLLPASVDRADLHVSKGSTVRAGETALAPLPADG